MTECNTEEQLEVDSADNGPDPGMEQYIGTKIIHARPCTAGEAENILGRSVCRDNADAEGNGYLVQYENGYTSWSPALAFEEAYRKCEGMTFGLAQAALMKGLKVARPGWNGNGMYLQAQFPDERSKMTFPYLYLTVPGCEEGTRLLPWQPAQVDLFKEDWVVVD